MSGYPQTSNAQLAHLLSESYREIEILRAAQSSHATAGRDDIIAQKDSIIADLRNRLERAGRVWEAVKGALGDLDERAREMEGALLVAGDMGRKRERESGDPPRDGLAKKSRTNPYPAVASTSTSVISLPPVPGPVPPASVYPPTNEVGQRICRACGRPGRYKEDKCVEKWGPGPLGPGTVCDRCRKKMKREASSLQVSQPLQSQQQQQPPPPPPSSSPSQQPPSHRSAGHRTVQTPQRTIGTLPPLQVPSAPAPRPPVAREDADPRPREHNANDDAEDTDADGEVDEDADVLEAVEASESRQSRER